MKKIWGVFTASLALLLAIRLLQMFLNVFPKEVFPVLLICSAAILCLLTVLFAAFSKKTSAPYRPVMNVFCTVFGAFASFSMIYRSVYDIYNLLVLKEFTTRTFVDRHPVFYAVAAVLGIVCATVWLAMSLAHAFGTNPMSRLPLLALLVPVWYCYTLFLEFVTGISRRNSAENSLEVLAMVFILLFLFFHSKLISGVEETGARKRCFVYGLPAILCVFSSSLLYLIFSFSDRQFSSALSPRLHIMNLLLSLYILFFLIALTRQTPPALQEDIPDEPEEVEAPAAFAPAAESAGYPAENVSFAETVKPVSSAGNADPSEKTVGQDSLPKEEEKTEPPAPEALPVKEEPSAPPEQTAAEEPVEPEEASVSEKPISSEAQDVPAAQISETPAAKEKAPSPAADDIFEAFKDLLGEKPVPSSEKQASREDDLMRRINDIFK